MSQHPLWKNSLPSCSARTFLTLKPGDSVRVQVKIKEGDKERVQAFEGTVISMRSGPQGSFTVRKVSFGQGVERIFPLQLQGARQGRDRALKPGAPRQAVLPARAQRQGRPPA